MSEPTTPGAPGPDEAAGHGGSADAQALAEQGALIIQRVVALMRTARTYDVSNMAFQRQLQEFMGVLRRLLEIGRASCRERV